MPILFFYVSMFIGFIVLKLSNYIKPIKMSNVIIGFTTIAYSIAFDFIFGYYFGLYKYIDNRNSLLYMILAGVFIYPLLNIIYTLFIPNGGKMTFLYTSLWIIGLMIFEYASILTRTIVLTGWKPLPWSIITYIVTYSWIYYFYEYLQIRLYKKTPQYIR